MDTSATIPPVDLFRLYKSRQVRRISTFADVAGQVDPDDIAAAYRRARDAAPQRHAHNKKYFVDRSAATRRSAHSNRREEHLALALWGAAQTNTPTVLPTGETLEILDYQTPLKARRSDSGIGKVDLFGLVNDSRAAIIELKIRPVNTGYGDTPLHAYLEALAYCAIVESNLRDIRDEAHIKLNRTIDERPPGIILLAPQDYWTGYLGHRSAGAWWPVMNELAVNVDSLLGTETHFLSLRSIEFRMGTDGENPELIGELAVSSVR